MSSSPTGLQAERFFELAFVHSPIGASVVDLDGRILLSNPAYARLVGYRPEELEGHSFLELTHPDDRAATRNAVEQVRSGASLGYRLEKRYLHRSGAFVYVLISATAIPDDSGRPRYMVAKVVDISQQKELEEQLRASEERWSFALEAADHGVWDWEPLTGRLFRSPGWLALLGYPGDEGEGRVEAWEALVHPDDFPQVLKELEEHLEGTTEAFQSEYRIRAADDNYRWVRDQGRVMSWTEDGVPSRVIGTITDITLQREMASRIREGSLWEVSRRLTAGFSHEFNNLLTVIMGSVGELQLLLESTRQSAPTEEAEPLSALPHEAGELLASIQGAAARARELTGELLSYARQQPLDPRPVDLNRVLRELEPRVLTPGRTDVEVKLELEEGLPRVRLDETRLRSALMHLTDNAQEALPQGGVVTLRTWTFAPSAASRTLDRSRAQDGEVRRGGGYVAVTVEDDGVGVPPELVVRVFDPFFTTRPVGTASGLGLSMVQGFVRQSGGEITLEARPGGGTRVTLYFPAAEELSEAEEPAEAEGGSAVTHLPAAQDQASDQVRASDQDRASHQDRASGVDRASEVGPAGSAS